MLLLSEYGRSDEKVVLVVAESASLSLSSADDLRRSLMCVDGRDEGGEVLVHAHAGPHAPICERLQQRCAYVRWSRATMSIETRSLP